MVLEHRREFPRDGWQLLGFYGKDDYVALRCAFGKTGYDLHLKRTLQFFSPLRADFDYAELFGGKILLQEPADQGGSHVAPTDKSNSHSNPFFVRHSDGNDIRRLLRKHQQMKRCEDERGDDERSKYAALTGSFLAMRTIET
jgi:hypothetical protein